VGWEKRNLPNAGGFTIAITETPRLSAGINSGMAKT
jgi:hypothetical protein